MLRLLRCPPTRHAACAGRSPHGLTAVLAAIRRRRPPVCVGERAEKGIHVAHSVVVAVEQRVVVVVAGAADGVLREAHTRVTDGMWSAHAGDRRHGASVAPPPVRQWEAAAVACGAHPPAQRRGPGARAPTPAPQLRRAACEHDAVAAGWTPIAAPQSHATTPGRELRRRGRPCLAPAVGTCQRTRVRAQHGSRWHWCKAAPPHTCRLVRRPRHSACTNVAPRWPTAVTAACAYASSREWHSGHWLTLTRRVPSVPESVVASTTASPTAWCSDRCLASSCSSAASHRSLIRSAHAVWTRVCACACVSVCEWQGPRPRQLAPSAVDPPPQPPSHLPCPHTTPACAAHLAGCAVGASAVSLVPCLVQPLQLAHGAGGSLLLPPLRVAHPLEPQLFQRQTPHATPNDSHTASPRRQQQLTERHPLVVPPNRRHSSRTSRAAGVLPPHHSVGCSATAATATAATAHRCGRSRSRPHGRSRARLPRGPRSGQREARGSVVHGASAGATAAASQSTEPRQHQRHRAAHLASASLLHLRRRHVHAVDDA